MTFETLLVLVIGITSLTGLRILLAVIGKGHSADHPKAPLPREAAAGGSKRRVVRGTGRCRNLLYFVAEEDQAVDGARTVNGAQPTGTAHAAL